MRILVIQLARLGDILMTWPQVRALRKQYPDAQIDMLVRPRFKEAATGLKELTQLREFPVETIFEPLLSEPLNIDESIEAIDKIIAELRQYDYDWIINSTLSPASSFLTEALRTEHNRCTGYTRTSDGYLAIPDDVSSYIYAQVGVDRDNRLHLGDLFTLMVDAQPSMEYWTTSIESPSPIDLKNYLVIHVGASTKEKKLSAFKWRTFLTHLQKTCTLPIVLIGNEAEQSDAEFIALGFSSEQVLNLTGKLPFKDLFPLIANACLYLGADSAPLHIASLVGTPSLNISLAAVNFWETGPKAPRSRVLFAITEADLPAENISKEAMAILNNEAPHSESIILIDKAPSFQAPSNTRNSDWTWQMIFAIYMGGEWPDIATNTQRQGLKNLHDVNDVILEQIATIRLHNNLQNVSGIIQRCEEVIESVGNIVPELRPLIRWYQTQKSLIPPGTQDQLIESTEKVHRDFEAIIEFWLNLDLQKQNPSKDSMKTTTMEENNEPSRS